MLRKELMKKIAMTMPSFRKMVAERDQLRREVATLRAAQQNAPQADPAQAELLLRTQNDLRTAEREHANVSHQLAQAAAENAALREDLQKANGKSILDVYSNDPPAPRNALDIFAGAWSSNIPGYGYGHAGLFDDHRIHWFGQGLGGVAGKNILELGPLEGAHTCMMAQAGAHVTAIESNTNAYLKCLVVQNVLKFNADFMLGDFRHYVKSTDKHFDLVVASGVLYHMTEPWILLQDIARISNAVGIWTHYFDETTIRANPDLSRKFETEPMRVQIGNREIVSYKQKYLEALSWQGFCGGSAPESRWLTRDSLLGLLSDLGFETQVLDEGKEHQNGPHITLFAKKKA